MLFLGGGFARWYSKSLCAFDDFIETSHSKDFHLSASTCSLRATWIPHTPLHATCLKRSWYALPSMANCVRGRINRRHKSTLQIK